MKKSIKIVVLAAGMLLTAKANAQTIPPSLGIETASFLAKVSIFPETSRLRVYLGKLKGNEGTLFMNLIDAKGNEIYTRKFGKKETQAVVLLDFGELKDGTYTLELSDKNGKITKTFAKETETVTVRTNKHLVALN